MTAPPSLFVSHGSPMFAVDAGQSGPALRQWAAGLDASPAGTPAAVVIMSPHWMSPFPDVMTTPMPGTWHDFGGFPEALYALQYPAPGHPAIADQVLRAFASAGTPGRPDPRRPFDHGAWVPMMHLWPDANLPVVQVALPQTATAADVWSLGRALRPLREQGVLIVGSGSMTHNLSEFFRGRPAIDAPAAPYVQAFARWIEQAVLAHDVNALLQWQQQAPHALRAHPSDDHFLPLFFALGAADDDYRAEVLSREVMYGILAMDALAFH